MKTESNNSSHSKIIWIPIGIFAFFIAGFFSLVGGRAIIFSKLTEAEPVSQESQIELKNQLKELYSQRYETLQPLPYNLANTGLNIFAESAILIDISNGNIIYEKNADEIIPPASMTKLFTLYIVDQEVAEGRLSYNQIIPIPEEAFACNAPPHSSLMFLGEGQIVTLEELILGLSISSGNDAAYALAYTISGSMENFIKKMNQVALDLGLTHTKFVESSGYSELNQTTAREMAEFCRIYISKHPESLAKFHSVPEFTYPKPKNMAPGDTYGPQDFSNGFPRHITMGITQKNTNPMLGYPGCDGLKTGYIDESGYNLSLTAKRDGVRYLSVTMKGPGKNPREGQEGRVHDGTELMNFAFSTFTDYHFNSKALNTMIKVYNSKQTAINLVPAFDLKTITIPKIENISIAENLAKIKTVVEVPEFLWGTVTKGQVYGQAKIFFENYLLDTIPLVADRSTEEENFLVRFADNIIY